MTAAPGKNCYHDRGENCGEQDCEDESSPHHPLAPPSSILPDIREPNIKQEEYDTWEMVAFALDVVLP